MRGSSSAAVAVIGLCYTTVIPPPSVTFLTLPQQDRVRSRTTGGAASVSADGRYLAFASYARLSPMDLDDRADVYVLDRLTHAVTLESTSSDRLVFAGDCHHPSISGDGRYVVFEAAVFGDVPSTSVTEIILRDRATGTMRRISTGPDGVQGKGWSSSPAISATGRTVVFASTATNLVPEPDGNGSQPDIYVFDVETNTNRRVSVDAAGLQRAGTSVTPTLSGDGRYIAFSSTANFAAPSGTSPSGGRENGPAVYLRDTAAGRTTAIPTVSPSPNGASTTPVISADAKFLAFVSRATNLVAGDRNRLPDVFLSDMTTGAVTLVSRGMSGGTANGASLNPAISADGRFVVFQSDASDMACERCQPDAEDINLVPDVFLFDRTTRAVTCVSTDSDGRWLEESGAPAIDASGQVIVFTSKHPIAPHDTTYDFDLFVRLAGPSSR